MFQANPTSASIDSSLYWNATGIYIDAGEEYQFTAEGKWIDKIYVYTPAGGPSPVWYLRLFEPFRRMRHENWFRLCGAINHDKTTQFPIGISARYTSPVSGELTCFANDVPGFYGNNKGVILLKVDKVGRAAHDLKGS